MAVASAYPTRYNAPAQYASRPVQYAAGPAQYAPGPVYEEPYEVSSIEIHDFLL